MRTNRPLISIIIPTRNRPEYLRRCLRSIEEIEMPFKIEIVIVDNSSNEQLSKKNKETADYHSCKYLTQPKRGLCVTKSVGIKESIGKILVFLDDDYILEKSCIVNLMKNFNDRHVACCTGRVLPYQHDEKSKLFERFSSFDKGNVRRVFSKCDISLVKLFKIAIKALARINRDKIFEKPVPKSVGCSFFAIRKEIFKKVGFFDENLGLGTKNMGGDDPDILYRILKQGNVIVYDPTVKVYHVHRQTWNGLYLQAYSAGVGERAFSSKYFKKDPYIFFYMLDAFFYFLLSTIKTSFKDDKRFGKFVYAHLRGFMKLGSTA
jgi:glycosyltransferase involved in cell wall biosynthesis